MEGKELYKISGGPAIKEEERKRGKEMRRETAKSGQCSSHRERERKRCGDGGFEQSGK